MRIQFVFPPENKPAPPDPGADSRTNPWPSLVRWIVGSAGLVGLLTCVGFIMTEAYEDFLGFHVSDSSGGVSYALRSGQLFYAAISVAIQLIAGNLLILAAVTAFALVAALLIVKTKVLARISRTPEKVILLLGAFTLLHFALLNVPSFFVSDMLVDGGRGGIPGGGGPVAALSAELRREHICGRLVQTDTALATSMGIECPLSNRVYLNLLRARFVADFVLATASLLALISIVQRLTKDRRDGDSNRSHAAVLAASVMFVADVCATPYEFSKTARRTTAHRVIFDYVVNDSVSSATGYLLDRGKDGHVLYEEQTRSLWMLPTDDVSRIQILPAKDVLEHHLRSDSIPKRSPPPPLSGG